MKLYIRCTGNNLTAENEQGETAQLYHVGDGLTHMVYTLVEAHTYKIIVKQYYDGSMSHVPAPGES